MSSVYEKALIQKVIDASNSQYWHDAVSEWEIADCDEDSNLLSSCICGKENLRYLFTIENIHNCNILYPIGSSCIKKFNRDDLNDIASIKEKLFKLFHAIQNNEYITLTSELFSRKLLTYLYDNGAC